MLGYQLVLFPWSGEPSAVPAVDYCIRRSEWLWDSAHVRLQWAIHAKWIQADGLRHPHPNYQPDQRIWLSTKLSPRYIGPFHILK